jgi:hypothetical protein
MKARLMHEYEGGHSLSAIALELGFAVSTVNNIVNDSASMKEHVNFILHLTHVCLSISKVFHVYSLV